MDTRFIAILALIIAAVVLLIILLLINQDVL